MHNFAVKNVTFVYSVCNHTLVFSYRLNRASLELSILSSTTFEDLSKNTV